MRVIRVSLAAFLWLGLAASAQAEQRMFIVANDSDGYGIDRCLATGARCGAAAANAYCKTQEFAEATTYHKIDRGDITGAAPSSAAGACRDNRCEVVAIVCTR
jgi:uncharacterized low-complexity protein